MFHNDKILDSRKNILFLINIGICLESKLIAFAVFFFSREPRKNARELFHENAREYLGSAREHF